jgi:type VI secretion system protein ImpK
MSNGAGDDPFRSRDATVLRPRPGAGRRGGNDASPVRPSYASGPAAHQPQPLSANEREALGIGLNPLVQAASPLLLLAGRMRGTLQGDVASLRREAHEEMRRFEERARNGGVANEVMLAARYALCAALDEAVLSTPWGSQSEWTQQSLLVLFHREARGGEKFFEMLEQIARDPARHIELMELQYLCLSMGFAGKYQVAEQGQARLAEIRHDLYARIRLFRGNPATELSLRWQGVQDRRNPVVRYVPWWVVGAASLAMLALALIFFHVRLGQRAASVHAELAKVGLGDFTAPGTPVTVTTGGYAPEGERNPEGIPRETGPTLKELLAADEARGVVSVEEQGGRTLITLTSPNLFASGSTKIDPSQYEVLQHIANAVDEVPGRVLVVGHTDDQPLNSLRYRDNLELSRERALSVVNVMKLAVDQPGRLEHTGVGSTEPRYTPESTPQNRARNRRVEIVHVAQAG